MVWLGKPITDATWESSQALPMQMVSDYEAGIVYNVKSTSVSAAGQTVHTLSSAGFNLEFRSRGGKCKIWRNKGGAGGF